ncbi:MAG: hypothetical protein LLG06_04125 [Desulfobacteraceae bacterium]|nr:hypothetical protein [Desulfobacteraceae bacterium]
MPEQCEGCLYFEHCIELLKYRTIWSDDLCLYTTCPVCGQKHPDNVCPGFTAKA